MGRGSLVGRRAMRGRVEKTDACGQGSKRESGGGGTRRSGEWGGNGCTAAKWIPNVVEKGGGI